MDSIINLLHSGLSSIIPLVILLGLLIFVHEMGHFLVAKYFKVRVEVFSLGFGKKILKFRKGETEYCLSLIPLGGYVKMYGDDPTAEIPEERRSVSFIHKPVMQRIAIVLAGPLMNFFFAILLFGTIALVGEQMPRAVVGDVAPSSDAYKFGFRTGDTITKVNEQAVTGWDEFKKEMQSNGAKSLVVEVKHRDTSEPEVIRAETKLVPNENILSTDRMVGGIDGLSLLARSTTIGVASDESPAAKAGFKSADTILSVNGVETLRWLDLVNEIERQKTQPELVFKVDRPIDGKDEDEGQKVDIKVASDAWTSNQSGEQILSSLGFEKPDLYLQRVNPKSAADAAGLKKGDKIVALNGVELKEWPDLVTKVKSYKVGEPPLKVTVLRDGKNLDFDVTPQLITQKGPTGHKEEVYALGVLTALTYAPPLTYTFRAPNFLSAASLGVNHTIEWSKSTVMSFVKLITNEVSATSIGGPVMIGQIASKTFKIGLSPFLKIMAIISINLFVLNLLPIPVLDGGHLVFYSIEAIRGAPLSMRKMEIAQQVGLALLMGLMVFALFNDITRLFNG